MLILNALDGILTYIGLKMGYIAEGNPILAMMNPETLLMIKLIFVSALIIFAKNKKHLSRLATAMYSGLIWVYSGLIAYHIAIIGIVVKSGLWAK